MRDRRLLIGVLVAALAASAHGQGGRDQAPAPRSRPSTPPRDRLAPQTAPSGTSVLRGVVVTADSGQPIRRAQVQVSETETRFVRGATTDAQGRFEIRELPAGRFTISASKAGFVPLRYGQRRPMEAGTPVTLGAGEINDRIAIGLPRGSVISGRVTDEFGDPVVNANVIATRAAGAVSGPPLFAGGGATRDSTDDLGQYRLFGLMPGDYKVSASVRGFGPDNPRDGGDMPTGFAPTYYPGVASPGEAQVVRVGVSQETSNVSFALLAARLVRVSGTVVTSSGAPAGGGQIMLVPPGSLIGPDVRAGGIQSGGRFQIANVPPGEYILRARVGRNDELARMPVVVGQEAVENLVVATGPGAVVTGRVIGPGGRPPQGVAPRTIEITSRPADLSLVVGMGASRTRAADDWTFEFTGLDDARIFEVDVPSGWMLRQITLDGRDVTNVATDLSPGQKLSGLEIEITNGVTAVAGSVLDGNQRPVVDTSVVIFPSDDQQWTAYSRLIRSARPDESGRFQFTGLPPHEDYLIAAVQGLDTSQLRSPAFLATLRASATAFRLREGESKTMNVVVR